MYCKRNFVAYHHKYSGHKQGILLAVNLKYQTRCDTKLSGITEIPSKMILLNVYEINERYNFEVPAIQIPVLMLFNKQELQDRNIFSGVSSCGIFMGRRRFSVSSATGESRKKAPMRIQSDLSIYVMQHWVDLSIHKQHNDFIFFKFSVFLNLKSWDISNWIV